MGTCSKKLAANVYVVEVNSGSAVLVYSSVIGGSASDQGQAITVDAFGNTYLTGFTQSADFPTVGQVPGAFLGSCGTAFHRDAFVVKIGRRGAPTKLKRQPLFRPAPAPIWREVCGAVLIRLLEIDCFGKALVRHDSNELLRVIKDLEVEGSCCRIDSGPL
jgi:hypothetical protein